MQHPSTYRAGRRMHRRRVRKPDLRATGSRVLAKTGCCGGGGDFIWRARGDLSVDNGGTPAGAARQPPGRCTPVCSAQLPNSPSPTAVRRPRASASGGTIQDPNHGHSLSEQCSRKWPKGGQLLKIPNAVRSCPLLRHRQHPHHHTRMPTCHTPVMRLSHTSGQGELAVDGGVRHAKWR